jgi:phosphoserine aminotransferase
MNRDQLLAEREKALKASRRKPKPTSNPFFGVGPITDGVRDEVEARKARFEFEHWLEKNYRKYDDKGRDIGPFTVAEVSRSMHRGYPADKIILDMMREIHRYFEFPKSNRLAVGLGGGHSGFTVAALHMITADDANQNIYIDTPQPESEAAKSGGFFRQSWGAQIVELMHLSKHGDPRRLFFAEGEGHIPTAAQLQSNNVKLIIGVGHETTGATTYSEIDVQNLLAWLDADPENHHAVLDATSMLGAMPWPQGIIKQLLAKCCFFMPFQKAIGGISGYYVISFTPQALALVEKNQQPAGFAIPRQMKLAAPVDAKKPLSGERTVNIGPFYDPATDKMLGGVINTFSTLAFAETTFGLKRMAKRVGDVTNLNKRSTANRDAINTWIAKNDLLQLGVTDAERRGAAVTLLKVNDPNITSAEIHNRIIAKSKQLLAYDGITHPNGDYEPGLDSARYVNAFPGTPGDYRAWIGGIRDTKDITALLENLQYAYTRAKIVVLEEELSKLGVIFKAAQKSKPQTKQKLIVVARHEAEKLSTMLGAFDTTGKGNTSALKKSAAALSKAIKQLKP